MKNREIDMLIVVNMFLTGFDATTLNTLWVDKNLKYHGLIQAFSRTNRILNSIKTFGNIICFRDLQQETDDAIALFGDKDAGGLVLMKDYDSYYNGYDENGKHHPGYKELVQHLLKKFPIGELIVGESNEKEFINTFSHLLRILNILTAFDQFKGNELLSDAEMQDYQSMYISLYEKYVKQKNSDKESINDDIEFETELVKQIEVNIDYILMLIQKYHASNCEDKEIVASIKKIVTSSFELKSKKELIDAFLDTINVNSDVIKDWIDFINKQSRDDLMAIINEEKLKEQETFNYMKRCFEYNEIKTTGTDLDSILPKVSIFGGGRAKKKEVVLQKLTKYYEKYEGLI